MIEGIGGVTESTEELHVKNKEWFDKGVFVADLSRMIFKYKELERKYLKLKDGNKAGS